MLVLVYSQFKDNFFKELHSEPWETSGVDCGLWPLAITALVYLQRQKKDRPYH